MEDGYDIKKFNDNQMGVLDSLLKNLSAHLVFEFKVFDSEIHKKKPNLIILPYCEDEDYLQVMMICILGKKMTLLFYLIFVQKKIVYIASSRVQIGVALGLEFQSDNLMKNLVLQVLCMIRDPIKVKS